MATPAKKRKRDLELETLRRKNMELAAQLAHIYHFVTAQIDKAGKKYCMASGVLVRLHALGGREICPPFVIKNGLSDETIKALKADAAESYELAIEFKP
jgi:hypothetical protein